MLKIPLTQGKTAIVDDEDGDLLAFKWQVLNPSKSNKSKTFYARRTRYDGGKRTELLHKVIGARKGVVGEVDHRDRDGLNCRRENLRAASHSQNCANRSMRQDNTSGVKGVFWSKDHGKWRGQVMVAGKRRDLGLFDDLGLAELAVKAAREAGFGEFACHGDGK